MAILVKCLWWWKQHSGQLWTIRPKSRALYLHLSSTTTPAQGGIPVSHKALAFKQCIDDITEGGQWGIDGLCLLQGLHSAICVRSRVTSLQSWMQYLTYILVILHGASLKAIPSKQEATKDIIIYDPFKRFWHTRNNSVGLVIMLGMCREVQCPE